MGILDVFKFRPKEKQKDERPIENLPDEDYPFPHLEKGEFSMTEELFRRKENEELLKRYGIALEKTGEFV